MLILISSSILWEKQNKAAQQSRACNGMEKMSQQICRETDDLKWSGSDHDLDHYLARKDRIVAHIFEKGKR